MKRKSTWSWDFEVLAFYNEHEPYAADWLRRLISAGHIANGVVDERSIVEIDPDELGQYTQCHFFAGIGGWSYALRLAGASDDFPVWTGSCPCQPFSTAGKQRAADDERHLWPAFFNLIRKCRPRVVFGEQVAGNGGYAWWDAVAADLESEDYAAAAADIGAHTVGAPHIRQRLYWVADAREAGREQFSAHDNRSAEVGVGRLSGIGAHDAGRLAHGRLDNNNTGLEGLRVGHCAESGRHGAVRPVAEAGESGGVDYRARPGPTRGFWGDADWLFCRDGKWRPVEPGTFPLAHGAPARVGRLRAYGNAIVPQVAEVFIRACLG